MGPGPRLWKKNLPGCSLTKVEKHFVRGFDASVPASVYCTGL